MPRAKLSSIIECFEANGPLSLPELCEEVGASSRSVRIAVNSLVNSGFLEVVPSPTVKVWDHKDLEDSVVYQLTKLGSN